LPDLFAAAPPGASRSSPSFVIVSLFTPLVSNDIGKTIDRCAQPMAE
jgi:hypothetical protein